MLKHIIDHLHRLHLLCCKYFPYCHFFLQMYIFITVSGKEIVVILGDEYLIENDQFLLTTHTHPLEPNT